MIDADTALADEHDCLLMDLDGTVHRGAEPVEAAVSALAEVTTPTFFVTNNASRTPGEVAARLRGMGFAPTARQIVTSAQCAARLLAARLRPGARVFVVGTQALAAEIRSVGLTPVGAGDDDEDIVAVVQGHSPHTGWSDLARAAVLIRAGAHWVATNADVTLPTERGLVPGNGSMVAALRAATDREPVVAGKPRPAIVEHVLARGDFRAPLLIGDRLDTDIACANAAGVPSVLVCTGVSRPADLLEVPPQRRPTHLAADLRCLTRPGAATRIASQPSWRVAIRDDVVTVASEGIWPRDDGLVVVRALAWALWQAGGAGRRPTIVAGDDRARQALLAAGLSP